MPGPASRTPIRRRAARAVAGALAGIVLATALCLPAGAVITRLFPLADVISDADVITAAKVRSLDRKRHVAVLAPESSLKGKTAWRAVQLRLSGSDDRTQTAVLEQRLRPGRELLFFTKSGRFTLVCVDGTWFRIAAPPHEAAQTRQFVHLELYLRRTFHGSTTDLRRVVTAVLAGKEQAPAPDASVKPGYGPA